MDWSSDIFLCCQEYRSDASQGLHLTRCKMHLTTYLSVIYLYICTYIPASWAKLFCSNGWMNGFCLVITIVCEYAYSLSQNLDPRSDGRGVLQFKTGLLSIIKVPTWSLECHYTGCGLLSIISLIRLNVVAFLRKAFVFLSCWTPLECVSFHSKGAQRRKERG